MEYISKYKLYIFYYILEYKMNHRSQKDTSEEHSIRSIDKRKKKNPRKILNDKSTKQDESIQNTNNTNINEIKDYKEESQKIRRKKTEKIYFYKKWSKEKK